MAPLSVRLLHPSSEPLIFSTGENKQFKPLILCHCIYSLPLITGAFLNIFKWLETYHSLSEFLLNEIEWHTFSLQRYSFLYPLFVINLFQPNAWQATKIVHTVTWSSEANYRRDVYMVSSWTTLALVDLTPDYSPEKFLTVLRKFESLRGYAVKLISDNGAQLTVANEELRKVAKSWDWDELTAASAEKGMEWAFLPADAPQQKRHLWGSSEVHEESNYCSGWWKRNDLL